MAGIAVLGAGLQGSCIALELASRGCPVVLVEQDPLPINRASLRNEGKIHLGLVYAQDLSMRTGRMMLAGALSFGRLLSRWTAGASEGLQPSTPFLYLVPSDSARSPAQLADYYETLQTLYDTVRRVPGTDYLGERPERLWQAVPADRYAGFAATDLLQAGYATAEAAIDTAATAQALRAVLAARPEIELLTRHRVQEVRRTPSGFRVAGLRDDGSAWTLECEQLVNALWDGRLAVDRQLGLAPARRWIHRLKYRVLVELPEPLRTMPSCTFVLGAYGDVVVHRDAPTYVSWYPACLRGWSGELAPPADWGAACAGRLRRDDRTVFAREALRAFEHLIPGLAESQIVTADAGTIFAWGETDITDRRSGLHQRDAIGVGSTDGYHSVNTGKLTTAPLFAVLAADQVAGGGPPGDEAIDAARTLSRFAG